MRYILVRWFLCTYASVCVYIHFLHIILYYVIFSLYEIKNYYYWLNMPPKIFLWVTCYRWYQLILYVCASQTGTTAAKLNNRFQNKYLHKIPFTNRIKLVFHILNYVIVILWVIRTRTKSKWVWSGNTTITHCRPTHGTVRKSHKIFTVTRQSKDNKSKATSSLFLVKIIAKQEMTQSNEYHTEPPQIMRGTKQLMNNNRTTAIGQTAV